MTELAELKPTVSAEDRLRFRNTVALFATGIAVVTVKAEALDEVHGMTINSFTSISLDPPTVMISLKTGRTHRIVSEQGCFGISLLHDEQEDHSAHFSGRPQIGCIPEFVTPANVPVLRSSLAWFDCEVIDSIVVHDHTVFFARVQACGGLGGDPLIFYGSKYHRQQKYLNQSKTL